MSEDEVRALLKRVVPAINWDDVGSDESLMAAGLDSLDKVTLIMEFETAMSTKIDDDRYDEMDTIADLAAYS